MTMCWSASTPGLILHCKSRLRLDFQEKLSQTTHYIDTPFSRNTVQMQLYHIHLLAGYTVFHLLIPHVTVVKEVLKTKEIHENEVTDMDAAYCIVVKYDNFI